MRETKIRFSLEPWDDPDDFPEAITYCFICSKRPITVEHVNALLLGGRVICSLCGAIHEIVGGDIEVVGFRV